MFNRSADKYSGGIVQRKADSWRHLFTQRKLCRTRKKGREGKETGRRPVEDNPQPYLNLISSLLFQLEVQCGEHCMGRRRKGEEMIRGVWSKWGGGAWQCFITPLGAVATLLVIWTIYPHQHEMIKEISYLSGKIPEKSSFCNKAKITSKTKTKCMKPGMDVKSQILWQGQTQ